MLDMDCFSFLNRAMESELCPIVVLATNRGQSAIRGTNFTGPHGIPLDLLDRLLIIPTAPYSMEELQQILEVRCAEEQVDVTKEALELLTRIAKETSLRYAIHMIMTSNLVAKKRKASKVQLEHVERCHSLFYDVERSTKYIVEYHDQFLFHEVSSLDDKEDGKTGEDKMEES